MQQTTYRTKLSTEIMQKMLSYPQKTTSYPHFLLSYPQFKHLYTSINFDSNLKHL